MSRLSWADKGDNVLSTFVPHPAEYRYILFHARLVGQQIIIEEDNFEESLTQALIASGVKKEDIVTHLEPAFAS